LAGTISVAIKTTSVYILAAALVSACFEDASPSGYRNQQRKRQQHVPCPPFHQFLNICLHFYFTFLYRLGF
jgi:hypothetical protein